MPLVSTFPVYLPDEIDADAYARSLKQLLPPGRIWNLLPASTLSAVMLAMGTEFARIDERGQNLIDESDPRTATEMLEDWERALSLPDDLVTAIPGTTAGRRLAVTQKFTAHGGQNYQFFADLVEACGYTLDSIDRGAMLRVGFRCGDRCYGDGWAYTMTLNINPPTGTALTHAELEAVVRHHTHAHITDIFVYL